MPVDFFTSLRFTLTGVDGTRPKQFTSRIEPSLIVSSHGVVKYETSGQTAY